MKIEPINKPVSEKDRATLRGELNRSYILDKMNQSGYNELETFEKDFFKEKVVGNKEASEEAVLEVVRYMKLQDLKASCSETILGRFHSEVGGMEYLFSNDAEAQINFDKAMNAFEKQWMSQTFWTAYTLEKELVRVTLTPETFRPVYMSHLAHIQDNISKLRDVLQPQVEKAENAQEIHEIKWESVAAPASIFE